MEVVRLEARIVRLPLRRTVKHASHTRQDTDNLIVRCVLSDKSVGWGEGVPRDYVTGETAEESLALLKRTSWRDQLSPCGSFLEAIHLAEQLRLAEVPDDDRHCQGNAARCAVELALLDAFGRSFGEPLLNVTRHLAPELYEPKEVVQYSGVILTSASWKARLFAFAERLYGFQQMKVKVGVETKWDVDRLRTIRRWCGPNVDLRVDANEAWDASEAVQRIQELEPFEISCVEQPIPHEQVDALAMIRQQIHTPIMLDESLCSLVDAERAIQGQWCDAFNLRLSKCGGFIPSLRLAELAKIQGLFTQLGCQVGESGILSAAGRHFACSVAELRYLEGSYDRRLVKNALTVEDLTFGRGGRAPVLVGSGLGVQVDPERVDSQTIQQEVLFGAA